MGSEIVIGNVGNYSGIPGSVFNPGLYGIQTWVRNVNERGGLRGHPLRLVAADDGGDPARNKAIIQEMVERKGAVALVGNYDTLSGTGSEAYLREKNVPVVGGFLQDRRYAEHPMRFPQAAEFENNHYVSVAEVASQLVPQQKSKVAIVACAEAEACNAGVPYWRKFAEELGLKVVYEAKTSIAQPDFTAECLAARNAGAEALFVALDGNSQHRLGASCARQGYKPAVTAPATATDATFPDDPNLAGYIGATPVYPWFVENAKTTEFLTSIRKYGPAGFKVRAITMEAWVAGKLFEAAGRNFGPRVTSADVLNGLWSIKNDDLGGLTQPLTFAKGANSQRRCWFAVKIDNGRFALTSRGDQLHCR